MADVTAVEQQACPGCGAKAEWVPAKQVLACAYCGTVAPLELDRDTGNVREIDLVRTLREMPDDLRGWQTDKRSVRCRSCHAVSVFDPQLVGKRCEFCGSPELVDYEELNPPIRPQSVLPFRVDEPAARESLRRWYRTKWLAPSALRSRAWIDIVRGIYLPYWTFDARVHCRWAAESGEYYYTTRTVRGPDGKTRTRRERHVRWRPAAGELEHFFDDEPVPASRGIDHGLLRQIEPFPTGELLPYDTAYLSGFLVEHYQVVLIDAAQRARETMTRKLTAMCAQAVPGDTHRNLRIDPSFRDQTFKHMLVPVWMLTYDYRRRRFQVLVNGFTGRIAGGYPKSRWKIFLLVAAAAILLGGALWIGGLIGAR